MPSSDYTSAIGGGLKLKGAKDAGIDKKKKKKKRPPPETDQSPQPAGDDDDADSRAVIKDRAGSGSRHTEKTETERKHEEVRRKRLEEKLRKEGAKTHKEKVEELNKYLSGLSEHHDMPRIGPG
ncbi:hypothetical protein BDZ85DRAFT_251752 [Elsinoe ampelina]|uniref:DUF1754-domain-containing protein n=1 Tax=Elsinoe ampelina TaxID=302913 RepID=A0A6A6G4D9_9PEZI|nr:hypothetical protein BDZ85DRAFT_251752 [Elsinoe ampelina]